MPYSPEHKRDTREKILESARRLFNRKGFSGVSIEEIMSNAGLTHGGFYRHFSGKDELYAAAVRQFLCKKTPAALAKAARAECGHENPRPTGRRRLFLARSLRRSRGCCPLIGTASDVERRGEDGEGRLPGGRGADGQGLRGPPNEPAAHERALALVALCVGGMVLARNVGDADLADDFRRAAHAEVLRTAGWN